MKKTVLALACSLTLGLGSLWANPAVNNAATVKDANVVVRVNSDKIMKSQFAKDGEALIKELEEYGKSQMAEELGDDDVSEVIKKLEVIFKRYEDSKPTYMAFSVAVPQEMMVPGAQPTAIPPFSAAVEYNKALDFKQIMADGEEVLKICKEEDKDDEELQSVQLVREGDLAYVDAKVEGKNFRLYFAPLEGESSKTWVFAHSSEEIKAARARFAQKGSVEYTKDMAKLLKSVEKGDVSFAVNLEGSPAVQMGGKAVCGELRFDKYMAARLMALMVSEEAAQNVVAQAKPKLDESLMNASAMLAFLAPQATELPKVLKSISMTSKGKTIRQTGKISIQALKELSEILKNVMQNAMGGGEEVEMDDDMFIED